MNVSLISVVQHFLGTNKINRTITIFKFPSRNSLETQCLHRTTQTGFSRGHSLLNSKHPITVCTSPETLISFIEQTSDFQPWSQAQLLRIQAPQNTSKNSRYHSRIWRRRSLARRAHCRVMIRSSMNSLVHFRGPGRGF
jgi:hypothetical protein